MTEIEGQSTTEAKNEIQERDSTNEPPVIHPRHDHTLAPEDEGGDLAGEFGTDLSQIEDSQAGTSEPEDGSTLPLTGRQRSRTGTGRAITRVTIGSALLALDTVSERLELIEAADAEGEPQQRTEADVLVPISEWAERFGEPSDQTARYLLLGMMVDARSKASKGGRILRRVSDATANALSFVIGPLQGSKIFSPVQKGFDSAASRGEKQVKRWIELGRAEDSHSRSVAQYALTQIAGETMDEIVDNQRVQVFIQDIVEAQSMGIIDEAIEEIRERALSSDNFIERPVRSLLRRPPRRDVPPPQFGPEMIRSLRRRHQLVHENTLIGHYAGFVTRLLAFVIDIALLAAALALSGWLITTILQIMGLSNIYQVIRETSGIVNAVITITIALYTPTLVIGYILVFWILTGQTLGMMVMGIRVVDRNGGRLTLWRAALRFLGFFIAAIPFFLGFVWIILDDRRMGWQDKIGGTYVVYSWDARPDETFLIDYLASHH